MLLTVIAIELLGGEESTIGYVAAVAGVGAVPARDAPATLMGRERLATSMSRAGALFAGAVALIGLGPGRSPILACVVGAGIGWAFVYVEALTLAQRLAGDDVMSRVFGVMESTMMASTGCRRARSSRSDRAIRADAAIMVAGWGSGSSSRRRADPDPRDRLVPSRVRELHALRAMAMFGPLSAPVSNGSQPGARPCRSTPAETIIRRGARRPVLRDPRRGGRGDVGGGGGIAVTAGDSFGEIALVRDIPGRPPWPPHRDRAARAGRAPRSSRR